MAKKLFIKTYGCQMNTYDSARMADVLVPLGYGLTDRAEEADLVVLNTCHIREKAAEKVYSELGRLKPLAARARERGRRLMIGVGGCVAQAEGEELARRAPMVDIVFGPQTYHRLADMVARAEAGERVCDTEFPARPKFDDLPRPTGANLTAFVSVQEGCDKFCTFCVVPYTRGAEYSRPAAAVIDEVRALARGGVAEVTLLGQNVNAYHGDGPAGGTWSLARLIRALADIDGLARIRYTTSHPRDMSDDLIAAHGEVGKLMPYLHLPVQSGSDRVLAAMNRRYGADDYIDVVDRLRRARPDIALSSDFIVGFPGETEADFEATLALVRAVTFAGAYSFKYSARPGTPAAEAPDPVAADIAADRLARLQALLAEQARTFNAGCVGRRLAVLFDKPGRRPGQVAGRSPYLQAVHLDCAEEAAGRALIGTVRRVAITKATSNSLTGVLAATGAGPLSAPPGQVGA